MKGIDIFNIKAIYKKVKKSCKSAVYTRMYNASKGNTSGLTEPLINAMIKVIKEDSTILIAELEAAKKQLQKEKKDANKQAA